jgi:hypothetical protein
MQMACETCLGHQLRRANTKVQNATTPMPRFGATWVLGRVTHKAHPVLMRRQNTHGSLLCTPA